MIKRAFVPFVTFVAVSALVACGSTSNPLASSGSGAATTSSGAGAGTTSSSSGAGGGQSLESYTVSWGPVAVMPGEENTQCVVKKLGNAAAFHAGTIHNVLNVGSHHMIVYKTNDTVEQPTPFACKPFTDLLHPEKGTPVMISQKSDDTLTLPQGVGLAVAAEQFVRLELHYINTSTAPLMVTATSTFMQMPEAQVKDEVGFFFGGDVDINIAPQSMATVGPAYIPLPTQLEGVNFFGITGHEHQWGTDVTVATTTAKTGTDTPIYDVPNWQWNEPKTVYLNPAVQVPQNGGFRLTCTFDNLSTNTVTFGESAATNEMCFFWSYYYPDKGALVCAHSDKIAGGLDLCCPGNPICAQVFP